MTNPQTGRFWKIILIDILIAALIAFFLINYVVSAFRIEGESMTPLLENGDRILISKLFLEKKPFERFELVVLYKPDEPEKAVIKRVVALPEETVEIRKGEILINDKPLKEPFLPAMTAAAPTDFPALLIPKGYYFVLGDRRDSSRDSRNFGPVPGKYIFGKALLRYWPFARFGRIE
jgi:signal peptidase I